MRASALLVGLAFSVASVGCASTTRQASGGEQPPSYAAARTVLVALALGTAGLAVGAALKGEQVEKDLRAESQSRELTGREFASRDAEGQRWNRIARASTFASALAVIGLGITFEMGSGDRIRYTPTPEGPKEVLPPPPPPPAAPPAAATGSLTPAVAFQRSATAR